MSDTVRTIGASSVAAVLGLSPWQSALDVWVRLRDGTAPDEATGGPLLRGQLLEPGLRTWYATTSGVDVIPGPRLDEPGWPVGRYGHARPDAFHPEGGGIVTVEIKSADPRTRHEWDHGIPAGYLAQVLWQMAARAPGDLVITGARVVGYVVDDAPKVYAVARDERRERALLSRIETWYERHVLGDDVPLSSDADRAAWAAMAPVTERIVTASDEDRATITAWRSARAAEKAAAALRRCLEQEIALTLGDALGFEGELVWSPVKGRTTVDGRALARLHPDIYARVSKTGKPTRRFRDLKADEPNDGSEE